MVIERQPVNSSSRFQSYIDYRSELSGHRPYKKLLQFIPRKGGRNNQGRICVRHQGGGHKRLYRLIDWKRTHKDCVGVVETIEYDPFRTAFISLIKYRNGARVYQIAIQGVKVGDEVLASENADIRPGNSLPLGLIPSGTQICCIELKPGAGAVLARSAGNYATVVGHVGPKTQVSLASGEVRQIPNTCWATIGVVSNADHANLSIGKAGRSRHLGIRPTVRGMSMNPVDHPMGGGEGRGRGAKHPRSPWGWKTKGYRTRRKPRGRDIITTRHERKRRG